jgi:hypothetical protein
VRFLRKSNVGPATTTTVTIVTTTTTTIIITVITMNTMNTMRMMMMMMMTAARRTTHACRLLGSKAQSDQRKWAELWELNDWNIVTVGLDSRESAVGGSLGGRPVARGDWEDARERSIHYTTLLLGTWDLGRRRGRVVDWKDVTQNVIGGINRAYNSADGGDGDGVQQTDAVGAVCCVLCGRESQVGGLAVAVVGKRAEQVAAVE